MTWGTGGSICTSGFNARDEDGQVVTSTAGHCGNGVVGNGWRLTGGDTFGYIKESHFPGSDWSSIRPAVDSSWSFPSAVKQAGGLPLQPISRPQTVCKRNTGFSRISTRTLCSARRVGVGGSGG